MAQQSARRGWKNQGLAMHHECAELIWFRSANSHTGPQLHRCSKGRTDGSIRLRAISIKYRLRLQGRPQMPDVLDGVQLGAFGRQRDDADILGHVQLPSHVPPRLIHQHDRVSTGGDGERYLGQMQGHGFGIAEGQNQTGALAVLRADRAEDVG